MIIGGIAVGFLGRPRLTEDVDAVFLLSMDAISQFLETAMIEIIQPRIPNAEEFARINRVLLLQHSPLKKIDISLGNLPFEEEMVARGIGKSTSTFSIRLPTPEDLIIMKAVAHRPKDLEDIRTIIDKNPKLDVDRIKRWVNSFSELLQEPTLWGDIVDLFKYS